MTKNSLQQCQDTIDYHFCDEELLGVALRHSSACDQRVDSNERLEFLGDAVLDIIICAELFRRFPQYLEGDLTILKSAVVSGKSCARVARELELQHFLQVAKGITERRGMPDSLAAAMLESIIGAIYLDGGLENAQKFVLRHFEPLIKLASEDQYHRDYKSMLQQHAQGELGVAMSYELLDEKGPDHNKCFQVAAVIRHHRYPGAWGITKKDAEQRAAYEALVEMGLIPQETASD